MKRTTAYGILGALIILSPFLGLPYSALMVLLPVLGLLILLTTLLRRPRPTPPVTHETPETP